jgi:A/G-specific adenine glycosylase
MSSTKQIAKPLLAWFGRHKRDLPWRKEPRNPYETWVSEVMLQQTRVDVVLPYYARFLQRFPTLAALARAPVDDVLALWSGLGYYARARNLHRAAQAAQATAGALPRTSAELRELPGFGPYTAAAVASLAFGEAVPLVDGNVARVFARLYKLSGDAREQSWALAARELPAKTPGEFNEALMELGALVCTPRNPQCLLCPLRSVCEGKEAPELFPEPKARAARPLLAWDALALLRKDGAVLLEKRAGEKLFGGLWELPREKPPGVRLHGELTPRGAVEQTLTHREVRVTVHAGLASGQASEGFRWVGPDGLAALGLSSLTKKTLKLVLEASRPESRVAKAGVAKGVGK